MRRLLAAVVEALARYGDPDVTHFANTTDEPWHPGNAWDDYGYHAAPTPPTTKEDR